MIICIIILVSSNIKVHYDVEKWEECIWMVGNEIYGHPDMTGEIKKHNKNFIFRFIITIII